MSDVVTPRRARSWRGYILLEAMLAGAIALVGMASLLNSYQSARAQAVVAARKSTAAQLINECLDELHAAGFSAATTATCPALTGLRGTYARTVTLGAPTTMDVGTTALGTRVTLTNKPVSVQVSFEAQNGTLTTLTVNDRLFP
jgi:type II secretory pathway pseudopilin PulG